MLVSLCDHELAFEDLKRMLESSDSNKVRMKRFEIKLENGLQGRGTLIPSLEKCNGYT